VREFEEEDEDSETYMHSGKKDILKTE